MRDKQIEEITEILANGCKMGGCEECEYSEGVYPECVLKYTADKLYNAGYRKASDVVREIEVLYKRFLYDRSYTNSELEDDIAKLKQKYESEGEG